MHKADDGRVVDQQGRRSILLVEDLVHSSSEQKRERERFSAVAVAEVHCTVNAIPKQNSSGNFGCIEKLETNHDVLYVREHSSNVWWKSNRKKGKSYVPLGASSRLVLNLDKH